MLQEHARDSFENLLFSLCRFFELTGHYPDDVLAISYDFKHERFADLHRAALLWPDHRFHFLGTPALMPGAGEVRSTLCILAKCVSHMPTLVEIDIPTLMMTRVFHSLPA